MRESPVTPRPREPVRVAVATYRRALAALFVLLGCGARTGLSDPAADAAVDVAVSGSPCARLAATVCARLATCAPAALANGITGGRAVGADRCVERVTLACDAWRAAPGLAASPAAVEACRAEVQLASCGEVGWRYFTDGPPCDVWPSGARVLGATCRLAAQCASGVCSFRADRGCGTCTAGPTPPTQRAGAACDRTRRCRYWLRCVEGTCRELAGEGEACTGDGDCAAASGLGCDRATMRCARRRVSPEGGACLSQIVTSPDESPSAMCGPGQVCFNRNDFGQGQCRPLVDDGAACLTFDPACAFPARCQGGRCALPADIVCAP